MNSYESYISEFLAENKEVALEKIGIIKTSTAYLDPNTITTSVDFELNRKVSTSPALINFITEKTGKNKSLIASDLESHLTHAREYINIGKTYEILNIGYIKANNAGEYEFIPFSREIKPQKIRSQAARSSGRGGGRSAIQFFTFLIVLAIVAGLGWEAYQFLIKPKTQKAASETSGSNLADTLENKDTASGTFSDTASQNQTALSFSNEDTVNVRYIFETTHLLLRAKTRIEQLKSFGNTAGYDSFQNEHGKFYSLYIYKQTKIADTLAVKDSLAKFLQKNIQIQIAPK